jgi:hypothetical protein
MSRRELTALLGFLGAVAGCIYLGWFLSAGWPGDAAFQAGADPAGSPISIGMTVYIFAAVILLNWRRNEPLEDERDRAIDGEAAKRGFYTLIGFNVIGEVVLHGRPGLLLHFGPEWLRLCLLGATLASVAVFAGYQFYRYRRG